MNKIKYLLMIIQILITQGCDTTDPPNDNIEPGRRDYTWLVDSVSSPGFPYLKSIWGSSANDVWGAGFSEDVRDCLWHYDGNSWKRVAEGTPITTSGEGSPIVGGVWGTAQNDVWAFGGRRFSNPERSEPFALRFNGNEWKEVLEDKDNMPEGFRDIYEINNENFWISSANNVYEYKSGSWKKYFIGENYIMESIYGIEDDIYLTAYKVGSDKLWFMKFETNKFIVVDETNLFGDGKFGAFGMISIENKIFTFNYYGAFEAKLKNNKIDFNSWETIMDIKGNGAANSFKISNKNIWAVGYHLFPYHYNGSNWQEINIYTENNNPITNQFWGIWGNSDEIFICDLENGKIYHGK